jgi:hypothetical protein
MNTKLDYLNYGSSRGTLSTLEFEEQDAFIKVFLPPRTKGQLTIYKIESNHPILQTFRGDAIKYQERRLNDEQRLIYRQLQIGTLM